MDSKKKQRLGLVGYVFFAMAAIVLLIFLLIFLFGGSKSSDISVSDGGKTIGLKCTDSEILHPALRDRTPISHTNTITADFADEELSSISLYYVGTYSSAAEAKQAEAYAQADYGLILAKEYGVNVGSFSHSFMIDGAKVALTITSKGDGVDSRTAPYFLLEQNRVFPKSLNEMKRRYEERNFSCRVVE